MIYDAFKIIVFTAPDALENEAAKIAELLDCGVDYVHLRKPGWNREILESLLKEIPESYHSKLKLHDHFELCEKYGLGGVHLNSRNSRPISAAKKISASCHSLDEISKYPECEYVTLSPVFDSISKNGYTSAFNLNEIENEIKGPNVIALGGVTPECFYNLHKTGFAGAALLGYIWNANFSDSLKELRRQIKNDGSLRYDKRESLN